MSCSEQIDGEDTEKDDDANGIVVAYQEDDACDKTCWPYYQ